MFVYYVILLFSFVHGRRISYFCEEKSNEDYNSEERKEMKMIQFDKNNNKYYYYYTDDCKICDAFINTHIIQYCYCFILHAWRWRPDAILRKETVLCSAVCHKNIDTLLVHRNLRIMKLFSTYFLTISTALCCIIQDAIKFNKVFLKCVHLIAKSTWSIIIKSPLYI